MNSLETLDLARIGHIREELRINDTAMGKAMGITSAGYRYKEEKLSFSLQELPLIAKAFRMSNQQLLAELTTPLSFREAQSEYVATRTLASTDNELDFFRALFSRRSELDKLLRSLPSESEETTPTLPPKRPPEGKK